ncbi:hypothetical protein N7444_004223 [Penicillium canescens]|nr:hypothetical protein N7444_004223 [Penicillium canescens]
MKADQTEPREMPVEKESMELGPSRLREEGRKEGSNGAANAAGQARSPSGRLSHYFEHRVTITMGWAITTLAASTAITSFAPEFDGFQVMWIKHDDHNWGEVVRK